LFKREKHSGLRLFDDFNSNFMRMLKETPQLRCLDFDRWIWCTI